MTPKLKSPSPGVGAEWPQSLASPSVKERCGDSVSCVEVILPRFLYPNCKAGNIRVTTYARSRRLIPERGSGAEPAPLLMLEIKAATKRPPLPICAIELVNIPSHTLPPSHRQGKRWLLGDKRGNHRTHSQ
jgi:hypothetical protein